MDETQTGERLGFSSFGDAFQYLLDRINKSEEWTGALQDRIKELEAEKAALSHAIRLLVYSAGEDSEVSDRLTRAAAAMEEGRFCKSASDLEFHKAIAVKMRSLVPFGTDSLPPTLSVIEGGKDQPPPK